MHTINFQKTNTPSFFQEYFAMMSSLPDLGQLVVNQENRIIYANKWISDITGNQDKDLIGNDISFLFQKQDKKIIFDALDNAGFQRVDDIGISTKHGYIKGVELKCVVQKKLLNKPKAFITLRDITWNKEIECMARVANEKLGTIEEIVDCGILVYNTEYIIEFANQLAVKISGRSLPNIVHLKIEKLFSDQDWKIFKGFSENPDKHKQSNIILNMIRPDRMKIPVKISLGPFLGSYDENKTYVIFQDLSSKLKMKHELEKSNRFLENVIKNSVDGIIAADMKGNITIFNEGAENLLGYKSDEAINKIHISDLYQSNSDRDKRNTAKKIMRRLRGAEYGPPGKLPTTPMVLIAKNGEEVPVNISAAIIYEGKKEVATVGIFTDLRERIKMQQQLIQSEKLSSLGTLAAGVAHELNNPLNNISITCQMLVEELGDIVDAENIERLQWIESHVDKAAGIVRTMLEFSREHEFTLSRASLVQTINDTIRLTQGDVPSNVEVRKEIPEDILLNIDKTRIEQALINLLINSIHAMEQGGSITIATRINQDKGNVTITVTDTGVGIPEENLTKIFDPFFTTKSTGVGTGLGLSLTYGIIEQHGGKITVSSRVGKGTSFIITLPSD